MGIEPIRPGAPSPTPQGLRSREAAVERPTDSERKDTVELSTEALQLQEAHHRSTLEQIRQRIERGEYNSPEVLRVVAHRILQELLPSKDAR